MWETDFTIFRYANEQKRRAEFALRDKEGWELVTVDNEIAYFKRLKDVAKENRDRTHWNVETETWEIDESP